MKQRGPRKARNPVARSMHLSKLFAPKALPAKKGKSTHYKRDRDWDRSGDFGPNSFWAAPLVFIA